MTQMTVLQPGDPFPSLTVALPGGRTLRLPDALAGRFGVVLYYRGSWCPYCNAQLSAFQRRHRPARPSGRRRPGRLPPRTHPGQLGADGMAIPIPDDVRELL